MLKFSLQFEHGVLVTTAPLEITPWRGCRQHVPFLTLSGVQVWKNKNERCHVLNKNLSVEAGATSWVNQNRRVKQSCLARNYKHSLSRQNQAAGDVSTQGYLLEPVVSYKTLSVEKNDSAFSPAGGTEEDKRFWNSLVTGVLVRDNLANNSDGEEGGSDDKRSCDEEPRERTKVDNDGSPTWRMLYMESIVRSLELRQGKVDHAANSPAFRRQLEEKILFLDSFDVDTANVLVLYPSIVYMTLENLKSVIYHLQSCDLRRKDLGRILSMTPQIFGLSLENHLRPAISFLLKEVGLQKRYLPKVINRCPRLLVTSIDNQLRPTVHFLQCLGFMDIAGIVYSNATLLTCSIQTKLIPKLEFLQTLGMSRDEAVTMVLRFPAIFNYSVAQNLQPKYEYLVTVMGRDLGDLKAFPQFFGYSLDKRIRPRFEYSVQHNFKISLPILLKLSDTKFYRRFKDPHIQTGEELCILPVLVEVGEKSNVAAVAESPVLIRGKLSARVLL